MICLCHMGYVRCDKKLQMPGLTESLYGNKGRLITYFIMCYLVLGYAPLDIVVRLGDKRTFLELPLSE